MVTVGGVAAGESASGLGTACETGEVSAASGAVTGIVACASKSPTGGAASATSPAASPGEVRGWSAASTVAGATAPGGTGRGSSAVEGWASPSAALGGEAVAWASKSPVVAVAPAPASASVDMGPTSVAAWFSAGRVASSEAESGAESAGATGSSGGWVHCPASWAVAR